MLLKETDSSKDLKLKQEIIPIRLLIDYRASTYFLKRKNNIVPAITGMNEISTGKVKFHGRLDKLIIETDATTSFLPNCYMKRALV